MQDRPIWIRLQDLKRPDWYSHAGQFIFPAYSGRDKAIYAVAKENGYRLRWYIVDWPALERGEQVECREWKEEVVH